MDEYIIKAGDHVIVQRQSYTKLHKLQKHGTIALGGFIIELDNVIGCKYFDTFEMQLQPCTKKFYTLEKVQEVTTVKNLNIEQCGVDNRNISDADDTQQLTKEDIDELKEKDASSTEIVEKLITNSKTFALKTEYSQEKYLKKKEKKYFEYVQIRKPTIRILAQMFYRQSPSKILGVRIDDLSQILTYANVQSCGDYVLYDSGTSGLITAAIMNAIGSGTTGRLVHMHPGDECQKNAFVAMQFPEEQAKRCINVNLYSVLRCFYQNKSSFSDSETKKCQTDSSVSNDCETGNSSDRKRKLNDDSSEPVKKKPRWQYENENACRVLQNKVDGLIIVSKDHPVNIVKELEYFLKGNRNVVVFSVIREPLQDVYVYMKTRSDYININLSTNFMRQYQVLPDRTHPQVNMNSGGYLLSAYKLAV